ncbi:MAG: hypothetical protein GEU88_12275, partial [Solirubrobacterales bacterium]|nr:hypothetical protein [Solirubrobacterales bacterium]
MPEASWRRDWRAGIAAVALHERLRTTRESGLTLGRVPLAGLRCNPGPESAVIGDERFGWSYAESDPAEPAMLRMPPGTRATYRLRIEAGARFEARLHAEGDTTGGDDPGVELSVIVRAPGGAELERWSRRLGGPGDGTIESISLPLPAVDGVATLELAATAPGDGSDSAPQAARDPGGQPASESPAQTALWIDPCLVAGGAGRRPSRGATPRFPGSTPARAALAALPRSPSPPALGERPDRAAPPPPAAGSRPPRFSILT